MDPAIVALITAAASSLLGAGGSQAYSTLVNKVLKRDVDTERERLRTEVLGEPNVSTVPPADDEGGEGAEQGPQATADQRFAALLIEGFQSGPRTGDGGTVSNGQGPRAVERGV